MTQSASPELVLSRLAAARLQGRDCLYKDKSYIGPVHVDSAECTAKWVNVYMTTRPWNPTDKGRRVKLQMPVAGTTASAFSVMLNAGYGVNGMFVHHPAAIQAIEQLRSSGAGLDALLMAVNRGQGLPAEVMALRQQPLAEAN